MRFSPTTRTGTRNHLDHFDSISVLWSLNIMHASLTKATTHTAELGKKKVCVREIRRPPCKLGAFGMHAAALQIVDRRRAGWLVALPGWRVLAGWLVALAGRWTGRLGGWAAGWLRPPAREANLTSKGAFQAQLRKTVPLPCRLGPKGPRKYPTCQAPSL